MLDANPMATLDPAFLNVSFLAADPDPDQVVAVEGRDLGPDRVRVIGRHVYAWLPDGIRGARLPVAQMERMLGTGTVRNWRTVLNVTDLMVGR